MLAETEKCYECLYYITLFLFFFLVCVFCSRFLSFYIKGYPLCLLFRFEFSISISAHPTSFWVFWVMCDKKFFRSHQLISNKLFSVLLFNLFYLATPLPHYLPLFILYHPSYHEWTTYLIDFVTGRVYLFG